MNVEQRIEVEEEIIWPLVLFCFFSSEQTEIDEIIKRPRPVPYDRLLIQKNSVNTVTNKSK